MMLEQLARYTVSFFYYKQMNDRVYRIIGCIAALLMEVAGSALARSEPVVAAGQNGRSYLIHSWKVGDGLPFNRIEDVLQRRNGFIWLATMNGAARFDGVSFQHFDARAVPGLSDNQIVSLFEDRSGTLYLGHGSGYVSARVGIDTVLLECPSDWLGQPITGFYEDADGTVWAKNGSGAMRRVGIDGTPVCGRPFIAESEVLPIQNQEQWTILDDRIVKLADGQVVEDRGSTPWEIKEQTVLFLECANGDLMAGSFYGGLFILHPSGGVSQITVEQGLASSRVLCLAEDAEGTVWVGTPAGLQSIRLVSYSIMNGTGSTWKFKALRAVAPRREGGVWIGTNKGHIYSCEGDALSRVMGLKYSETIRRSLFQGRRGILWMSDEQFLMRHAGNNAQAVLPTPPKQDEVWVLNDAPDGRFWAGGDKGLWENVSDAWTLALGAEEGVAQVRCFTVSPDGTCWIGTKYNGLFSWENGQLVRHEGVTRQLNSHISALCVDEEDGGALWVGSCGGGFALLKDGHVFRVPFTQNIILHISDDGEGRLWVVGERGIAVVDKNEAKHAAKSGSDLETYILFDKACGLNAPIDFDTSLSTACRTPDGRFWYASDLQLSVFHPSGVKLWTNSVPLLITSAQVNDVAYPLDGRSSLMLQPGVHRMDIHFAGLSFLSQSRIRFRCRMVGVSDEWVDLDMRRVASYQKLSAGKYRFEVIASNRDGIWNPSPTILDIVVKPFYWETWWFKVLVYFTLGGLIALISLAVAERLNRGKLILSEKRQAVEQERTRIAMDIHDEIGSELTRMQLLCHKVAMAVKRNDHDATPKSVREMEDVTGKLIGALDEIVWVVSPGNDNIENLAGYLAKFVATYLRNTNIACELDVPIELPCLPVSGPVRHNLFLAIKEALNNIVKHAEASRIRFVVSVASGRLTIALHDNGKGIASFEGERFQRGLCSMRRRMKLTGGIFNISNNTEGGTTVSFELPLKEECV